MPQPRRCPGRGDDEEAERAGFEPATHLAARTRFPVALLRPLGHLSERRAGYRLGCRSSLPSARRRGGRAVECGGLENRYPSLGGSRVQIPPPPLKPFFLCSRVRALSSAAVSAL